MQKIEKDNVQGRNKFATEKEHYGKHNPFLGRQKPTHFRLMTECFLSLTFNSIVREEKINLNI